MPQRHPPVTRAKLATPKQRAFVLVYLKTGNPSAAYRSAYAVKGWTNSMVAVEAMRTLASPNVAKMVEIGRNAAQARYKVTAASITEELEWTRAAAMQDGNHGAAVSATLGKAKLHGLLVERSVVTGHLTLEALISSTIAPPAPAKIAGDDAKVIEHQPDKPENG